MKPYGLHKGKLFKPCECVQCKSWTRKYSKGRKKAERRTVKKEIKKEIENE